MKKPYDFFVSYSHADRELVERLARRLDRKQVRIWWDRWEMLPGDILRERINEGIEASHNYIVVLSPASLNSPWVNHEINTAFIRSIEERMVRVIPAIAPEASFEDMPIDLRARYCVDLRDSAGFERALEQLVDLVQPARRARKELLADLRSPDLESVEPDELAWHALHCHDQTIEVAALRKIAKFGNEWSVRVCTERSMNFWGVSSIGASITCLGRLGASGGLLALSATVLDDSRFIRERLKGMRSAAKGQESALDAIDNAEVAYGSHAEMSTWSGSFLDALCLSKNDDVRYGAYFMRSRSPFSKWLGSSSDAVDISQVEEYIEKRVRGLYQILLMDRERSFE